MDASDIALLATQLAMGFALAAAAGLRAFLPIFVAGVLARLGYLELGHSFAWMASTPALVVFGSAVAFEFLGDKVPYLDHLLDAGGTFVKPVAATILAASLITEFDPLVATTIGLVSGGAVAGAVHVLKGSARVVSTGVTGGLGNPFLSFIEDAIAAVGIVLAFLLPVFAALLALGLLAYAVERLTRGMRRRSRASPGP
jgi:hypothetical protein